MSHDTNRIYTEVSGGVRYGVSVADVQTILGTSKNDLGQLCTEDAINKWAKYRPIDKPGYLGILTDAMRKAENWGIGNIPMWSNNNPSIGKMVNFWGAGNTSSVNLPDCGLQVEYWTRILPSAKFRLLDFSSTDDNKGYFHGAPAPISPLGVQSMEISVFGQLDVVYGNVYTGQETIGLSDFTGFDTLYWGVVFYNATYGTYIITQENTASSLSSYGYVVHITNPSALAGKTWKVWPCLAPVAFATLTHNPGTTSGTCVALLEAEEIEVQQHMLQYEITPSFARRETGSNIVEYRFEFANLETTTGLSGVKLAIEFRDTNNNVISYQGRSEWELNMTEPGESIPASSSVAKTGQQNLGNQASAVYRVFAHIKSIDGVTDYQDTWEYATVNEITRD